MKAGRCEMRGFGRTREIREARGGEEYGEMQGGPPED